MADELVIDIEELTKTYSGVQALRGLTLHVRRGSIYSLLGRNGAGKTTTMKILLGMVRPTSGSVRVLGRDAALPVESVKVRQQIGFVSDEKNLYAYMTVEEIVRFTAAFFPRWRRDLEQQYLRRFDLPSGRAIKTLSRGMRTKLALLLALCRSADLLVLDEPTSALDPAAIEEVLQALVTHVAREETTVLFSTHQIADAEQIADQLAIIHRGRVPVSGAIDELRERYRRIQLVFDGLAPQPVFRALGVAHVECKGRVMTLLSRAGTDAILDEVHAFNPISVDVTPVSLKDIFLETVSPEE